MFRCWAELQTLVVKDSPSREDYVGAIEVLRWAERIVVTGEALSQRLLGRHTLVAAPAAELHCRQRQRQWQPQQAACFQKAWCWRHSVWICRPRSA